MSAIECINYMKYIIEFDDFLYSYKVKTYTHLNHITFKFIVCFPVLSKINGTPCNLALCKYNNDRLRNLFWH